MQKEPAERRVFFALQIKLKLIEFLGKLLASSLILNSRSDGSLPLQKSIQLGLAAHCKINFGFHFENGY